jgi:hypothetical protein
VSGQHTPGPWALNTQYADIEVRGPAESGVLIAVMSPWGMAADTPSPQLANARLIAESPYLLAFAQYVLAECAGPDAADPQKVLRMLEAQAKAVVAKITGADEPEPIPVGEALDSDFGEFEAAEAQG